MFWERVLLAFLVSASSFCFSYYWYRKGGPQVTASEKSKEVAKLVSLRNEVQRKPSKRVIWESISRDETLYMNEAIKTGPDAEAVIEFTEEGKVGTRIHLEPDSVVVLEETGSDLTLDFLKGNVFVAGTGGEGLKIKSGNSTIAVGKGELNLNKSADGEIDLQVLKGSASVESAGKSIQLGENQVGSVANGKLNTAKVDLKILSAMSNRRVFVD
jgi:ferric-dicitrate binding protein FerR (iron transport regulator)